MKHFQEGSIQLFLRENDMDKTTGKYRGIIVQSLCSLVHIKYVRYYLKHT